MAPRLKVALAYDTMDSFRRGRREPSFLMTPIWWAILTGLPRCVPKASLRLAQATGKSRPARALMSVVARAPPTAEYSAPRTWNHAWEERPPRLVPRALPDPSPCVVVAICYPFSKAAELLVQLILELLCCRILLCSLRVGQRLVFGLSLPWTLNRTCSPAWEAPQTSAIFFFNFFFLLRQSATLHKAVRRQGTGASHGIHRSTEMRCGGSCKADDDPDDAKSVLV